MSPVANVVNVINERDQLLRLSLSTGEELSRVHLGELEGCEVVDFAEGFNNKFYVCSQNGLYIFKVKNLKGKLVKFCGVVGGPSFRSSGRRMVDLV